MSGNVWATYNCGSASDARLHDDLLKILDLDPIVLGLNEVGDRATVLAAVAKQSGYRLVQLNRGVGSRKIAALVSPSAAMGKPRIRQLTPRTKVGRRTAGARRTGYTAAKYLLAIPVTVDGHAYVYGVVHFVPSAMKRGNTATRNLHNAQVEAAAKWLRTRKRTAILGGDMNAAANKPRERKLLGALAQVARLHYKPSHGKRAIDMFVTDVRGSAAVVPGEFSSDHRPLAFREN